MVTYFVIFVVIFPVSDFSVNTSFDSLPSWLALNGKAMLTNGHMQLTDGMSYAQGNAFVTLPISNITTKRVVIEFDYSISCGTGCADGLTIAFGPFMELASLNQDADGNCNKGFLCVQSSEYSSYFAITDSQTNVVKKSFIFGSVSDSGHCQIVLDVQHGGESLLVTTKKGSFTVSYPAGNIASLSGGGDFGIVIHARSGWYSAVHAIDNLSITMHVATELASATPSSVPTAHPTMLGTNQL